MDTINKRIKLYRKANGWTQEYMAKRMGITQGAYSQFENANGDSMRVKTLRNFCETFQISSDELLGLTGNIVPLCQECNAEISKTLDVISSKRLKAEDREFLIEQLQKLIQE